MYFKKFKWADSPNLLHSVQSTWKMIGFVYLGGQLVLALGLVLASIKVSIQP